MLYHVSPKGNDLAPGTAEAPFRTISHAAQLARPGDTVQVHSGEYREWVDPRFGGLSEATRITYEAAPGEKPVIKGSEIVTGWERVEGTIWKKVLPNAMFGDWNPYKEKLFGDWMRFPEDYDVHYGDVYINGISMFEASSLTDLYEAPVRHLYMEPTVKVLPEYILHPELTVYRYLPQVDEETTTLLCNFQEIDPNENLIEINVRKCCFFPTRPGVSYITLRGFEICHAACPWAPPTAMQWGMVGPHWSKGWIIEDNHLHDAKCAGLSLGKKFSNGDNISAHLRNKSGHRHQLEDVLWELQFGGWDKAHVGSHIVRNNVIHDCGQAGIVGHMGCVFSRIEHNHIYNISVKREFYGHEQGGIKFHAAIDTVISQNNIHNCTLGIWLDWQAQGARVTGNVFHRNYRDFFVEVSHGPLTMDHNIFMSEQAMDDSSQGTALVHNLFAGRVRPRKVLDRDTPYHYPHSTLMRGFSPVRGADIRFYNNIYLGAYPHYKDLPPLNTNFGAAYDHYYTPEEFQEGISQGSPFYQATYARVMQPVWSDTNVHAGHAKPFRGEAHPIYAEGLAATLQEEDGKLILELDVPEALTQAQGTEVTTAMLGMPRTVEMPFENPDGTPLDFSADIFGVKRASILPGPFATLRPGKQRITVWEA